MIIFVFHSFSSVFFYPQKVEKWVKDDYFEDVKHCSLSIISCPWWWCGGGGARDLSLVQRSLAFGNIFIKVTSVFSKGRPTLFSTHQSSLFSRHCPTLWRLIASTRLKNKADKGALMSMFKVYHVFRKQHGNLTQYHDNEWFRFDNIVFFSLFILFIPFFFFARWFFFLTSFVYAFIWSDIIWPASLPT